MVSSESRTGSDGPESPSASQRENGPSSENPADSSALTTDPEGSSSQKQSNQFHIDWANLPVDVSPSFAKKLQERVRRLGNNWFPPDCSIKIEFCVFRSPDVSESSVLPRSVFCESVEECEEALQVRKGKAVSTAPS